MRIDGIYLGLSVVAGLLLSVTSSANATQSNPKSALERLSDTDGVWQSDGFGYVMYIDEGIVRFFHSTSDVCVETDNEDLTLDEIFDVQRFNDAGRLALSSSTEPFEFFFDRLERLPDHCTEQSASDLQATAEAIISFFSHHYVFFEERGLDWQSLARAFERDTKHLRNEQAFYDILVEMLAKTGDAHVELTAKIDEDTLRFDADPGLIRRQISLRSEQNDRTIAKERAAFHQDFWVEGIGEDLLRGNSSFAANDRIRFGVVDGDIGYIAVRSMGGFVSDDKSDGATEAAVLDAVMDRAIASFDRARARAVILDISMNSGGYEYLSRHLAGRFFDKRLKVYSVFAGDARDQTPQELMVEPRGRSQFVGPVYLLTSSETVSAAESLTMAMKSRRDVVHVGGTTRGALSTKLAKLLPNDWTLMLSNQVVLDHRGVAWEGRGIPPDMQIRVFPNPEISDEELEAFDFRSAHQAALNNLIAVVRADTSQ